MHHHVRRVAICNLADGNDYRGRTVGAGIGGVCAERDRQGGTGRQSERPGVDRTRISAIVGDDDIQQIRAAKVLERDVTDNQMRQQVGQIKAISERTAIDAVELLA